MGVAYPGRTSVSDFEVVMSGVRVRYLRLIAYEHASRVAACHNTQRSDSMNVYDGTFELT